MEPNPKEPILPSEAEAVDRALARHPGASRTSLLPLLQELQAEQGWLSRGTLLELSNRLGLPFPDVFGVATFYAMLSTRPRQGTWVRVCDDISCLLAGAGRVISALEAAWGPAEQFEGHGVLGSEPGPTWERVPCLGLCDHAPAALVDDQAVYRVSAQDLLERRGGAVNA